MNYHIEEHRARLAGSAALLNAYSPESLRILISHILKGGNYRLITERNTKEKLFLHYLWLYEIYISAREEYGAEWQSELLKDLASIRKKTPEHKNLYWWLNGITHKTSGSVSV